MPFGLHWSEALIDQLTDKEIRDAFVAEQVRSRIAQLVKILREQPDRAWTQSELGRRAGKKQNLISRLEDPDGAQPSVQTMLEIAAAFDLPLWLDIVEWEDWFKKIDTFPDSKTTRQSFDRDALARRATAAREGVSSGDIGNIFKFGPKKNERSISKGERVEFTSVVA